MVKELGADNPDDLLGLVDRFERALANRSWSEIRELFHEDSRIESIAAGGEARGPDETISAMAEAARSGIYSLGPWNPELLTAAVALVFSRMRHKDLAAASITDEGLYWLMTCRDGRFWRIRIFHERAAAIRCLDEHGPTLGLEPR